jgi:Zn-dependent protease with chaperone function
MPGPWRLLSLRVAFLLAITLGLFLPIRIQAQASPAASAADSDEDDDKPVSFLYVTVSLDAAGKASVQASYHAVEQANLPPSEIKQALQSALGCTLENSPRARPFPGFYFGSCTPRSSAQGLLRQGRISTAPLQDFSRLHDIPSTSLQLVLPDSDVLETTPPVRRNSTNSSKTTASVSRYLRTLFIYTGSPNNPLPSEIVFRYGYASSTLKRAAAILFLVLLSPLALFIWFGRKALSANVADKAIVWFSYMRSLQWILNASLIVWWVALDYCHAEPLLRFLSSATRFAAFAAHPVAYEALSWVPPAVLWLLCYRVSHPIQQKLRGLHWTKRELTLQALYSVLAGLFPFALFLTGLRFIGTDGFRSAMLWWVAAFFLRVVAAQALLKVIGMQPQALSWGDLRDRAFAMAERLGVKLQQVYLIPSGKGQAANAFARTGNTISFTDFLLKRMSQREVDYVMAHELTHLKLKHPAKLGYANMGGIFLGIMVLNLTAPFLHGSVVARYALMFTIVSVFPFFWSRRFEYSADAGAVAATGDPRAAISALFKLSELNMMPLHWSKWREKWLTHPSSTRRAQAIAKKAGIPFEEIPAIAREGAAEIQSYTIPSTAAPGGKVHSTQRTKSITLKLSLVLIGLLVFVPSLFSLAAIYSPSPVKWILFVAAIPATFLSFLLLMNYSPRLTRGTTVHALDEKLASQGIQAASWSGVYVGFSPAGAPRIYEGNSNWDMGYLFFRSDRLCYCGEETKFALRQNQVTAIKFTDGLPGFLSSKRIYVAWKDAERGACGVFNIGCGKANSTLHANKLTAELAQRLQTWWKTSPVARPLPPQLAELNSPELRAVTSHSLAERRKPKKVFNELLSTAILSAVGATLCGLPFHLLPYLLFASRSSVYARVGISNPFHTPGAGWYAVAVAVLVRFITMVPLLRYREAAKLTSESLSKRTDTPPPSAGSPPNCSVLEKVPVS